MVKIPTQKQRRFNMSTKEIKARPVPLLKSFLTPNTKEIELYPAPTIDIFVNSYGDPEISNAYKNENGDILFSTSFFTDWYILTTDNNSAYKLPVAGYGGTDIEFNVSLTHELDKEKNLQLNVNKNEGKAFIGTSFDDMKLEILSDDEKTKLCQSILNNEISCIGLPEVRDIEEALQFPNGDYLVVSCNKIDYEYETLHMFTGSSLDSLRQITINNVERFRDGGTTFYMTDEGILYTPFQGKGEDSTWTPEGSEENVKLTILDCKEMAQEIGNKDKRICGVITWNEYLKQNGPT